LWQTQVLPEIRGAQLFGYLDGSEAEPAKEMKAKDKDGVEVIVPNPEYARWVAQDQSVLGFLVRNMAKEVLTQMVGLRTAVAVWKAVMEMFSSQSQARIVQLRTKLNQCRKEDKTGQTYLDEIKSLSDEMAAAGKPLDNLDVISYILAGLDDDYDGFVAAITALIKADANVSLSDVYSQFMSYEARMESRKSGDGASVNTVTRGGRGGGRGRGDHQDQYRDRRYEYDQRNGNGNGGYDRQNHGGGRGGYGGGRGGYGGGRGSYGGGRGNGGQNYGGRTNETCQICGKVGHIALNCWKRHQKNYRGPEKTAGAAYGSYGFDSNWYNDSGATDHVTGELEKLHVRDRYNGNEQIHTASGSGMDIRHIGNSVIHAPHHDLHLNDILHVPQASKSLLSTSRLARDNHAFVEYWPNSFFVKDQDTREILLQGRCVGGLYPMPKSSSLSPGRQAHSVAKSSSTLWHRRLGHPSSVVVHQVLRDNNIQFSESNKESVCDACQQAKSHQLPYPKSSSVSTFPLELAFSDVWGPAPASVGRFKYYVSFIDDYSKFTWIYLLKNKSDVFQKFRDFQQMVERRFDKKIIAIQTDWGGEYQKLNSFFQTVGISHLVSCPHAHQQNGPAERKHRHIVEVGLSLLAYASMPLKYWDEAFLTAVYLINRLPSRVIDSQTPVERLFGDKGDYSFLRIFGCACWPNLRPYNNRKLDF
jgi:histone deacetylase 1/2